MKHWWEHTSGTMGKALVDTVENLSDLHQLQVEKMKRLTRLYKDRRIDGFYPGQWNTNDNLEFRPESYNVLKSSIDTITAKITQHKPNPAIATYGATEDLQTKAQAMEKLVLGVMQKERAHRIGSLAFRECGVIPISAVKVVENGNDICLRRIHPSRIIIDEDSALDGKPTSMYQYEWYSKSWLRAKYPKAKNAINECKGEITDHGGKLISERVKVYEAWQLPLGPKFPGKRVVMLEGGHIVGSEDWTYDDFPFVLGRWEEDFLGWYGVSLAENLEGVQGLINDIIENISVNLEETKPFWLVPAGAKILDEHLMTNLINRKVEYVGGVPPQRMTPPAVGEQEIRLLMHLIEWGYEIAGVSQLSATSKQPANFESGRALQTYLDVETIRHAKSAEMYENWYVDLFWKITRAARSMAKRNSKWSINYMGDDRLLKRVNWADANLEEDQFQVQVHPISALPQHPSARLERVMEMARDQIIGPEEFSVLADLPDLEKHNKRRNAPYDYLEKTFEHMLSSNGKYIAPLRYQPNLADGVKMATEYYMMAKIDDIPDEQCDRLARWIEEASVELEMQMQQQQPMPEPGQQQEQPMDPQVMMEGMEQG